MNITNYRKDVSQSIYDNFNSLLESTDVTQLGRLLYRYKFYEKTQHLPGDIVEIGVFKGAGILAWLKILKIFSTAVTNKKVIGFDFFDVDDTNTYLTHIENNIGLKQVLQRVDKNDLIIDCIKQKIYNAGFDESRFILIKGNICNTTAEFVKKNPGFKISILYIDVDIEEPTYYSLLHLWDRIVPGGYIVFDEYEFHSFDECIGVDRFLKEKNIEYSIETTQFLAPTAFMIKKK